MGQVRPRGRRGPLARVRALTGWAAVGLCVAAALGLRSGGAAAQDTAEVIRSGAELYATTCAACHGARGDGGPRQGELTAGPALRGIDIAYVDQQMRTGRMPLVDRTAGVVRGDKLSDGEREAVLAWMRAELDLSGRIPEVGEGDRSRGRELYATHCAACHGAVGNGGIVGRGIVAASLRGVDRVAIVEALRVGPYSMPAFGPEVISEEQADDIAAFTAAAFERPRRNVLGLTEQNRVGHAGLSLLLVLVVVAVMVLVARRVRMPTEEDT